MILQKDAINWYCVLFFHQIIVDATLRLFYNRNRLKICKNILNRKIKAKFEFNA